jgi:hypothetical protein
VTTAQAVDGRAALQAEFPGWHVWNSGAGRWWATRRGNARLSHDHDPGWSMTVDADDAGELGAVLKVQSEFK